jgi:pimeloyl-ACP methyl ester carboxylesterase
VPEADLGDVTLAYEVVGEGEPVVLVAGLGQPAIAWHLELVPALVRAGYQVVTFDNRGVPPSSAPPSPYSIGQMVTDTLGLLDHLGFDEPVRMAGHSMGGWIAETIAIEHSDRLRSAALMGSANIPTAWEKAITTVERDMARLDYDLPPLFYATETMRYLPLKELQRDEVVNGWLGMMDGVAPWQNPGRLGQYEAALEWSTDPSRWSDWSAIEIPCLVVAFEHDIDSPPDRARQAAALMPNGRYCEIEDAGHIGILTHASLVSAALVEFFGAT